MTNTPSLDRSAASETSVAYFDFLADVRSGLPALSERVFSRREMHAENQKAEFLLGRLLLLVNDQTFKTELEDDHDLSIKFSYMQTLIETLESMLSLEPTSVRQMSRNTGVGARM